MVLVKVQVMLPPTGSHGLQFIAYIKMHHTINHLTRNDPYRDRTAPLTSKRCILYIYSTDIGTEYFKRGIYSPFFLFKMQFVS
jgi:hypothetical protein